MRTPTPGWPCSTSPTILCANSSGPSPTVKAACAMPKARTAVNNLIGIYSCVTGKSCAEIEKEFDGKGYGDFKAAVAEAVTDHLRPIQEEYARLIQDKAYQEQCYTAAAQTALSLSQRDAEQGNEKNRIPPPCQTITLRPVCAGPAGRGRKQKTPCVREPSRCMELFFVVSGLTVRWGAILPPKTTSHPDRTRRRSRSFFPAGREPFRPRKKPFLGIFHCTFLLYLLKDAFLVYAKEAKKKIESRRKISHLFVGSGKIFLQTPWKS